MFIWRVQVTDKSQGKSGNHITFILLHYKLGKQEYICTMKKKGSCKLATSRVGLREKIHTARSWINTHVLRTANSSTNPVGKFEAFVSSKDLEIRTVNCESFHERKNCCFLWIQRQYVKWCSMTEIFLSEKKYCRY